MNIYIDADFNFTKLGNIKTIELDNSILYHEIKSHYNIKEIPTLTSNDFIFSDLEMMLEMKLFQVYDPYYYQNKLKSGDIIICVYKNKRITYETIIYNFTKITIV